MVLGLETNGGFVEFRQIGKGRGNGVKGPDWTDERIGQLKALVAGGLSASQMAKQLGGGVTRSAVLCKLRRLRIALLGTKCKTAEKKPKDEPPPKRAALVAAPERLAAPFQSLDGAHVTVLTVTDRDCHFPFGEPNHADFHFCGNPVQPGRHYCEAHQARVYDSAATKALGRLR